MGILSRSPWLIHYDGSSCNGCDIEVLACLTPVYDVERLGILNTGNPKHADIFLVTGSVNEKNREVVQNIYNQMPDPKVVIAVGICASSGGIFCECYNVAGGIDKVIPVDVYVPGCAARPESIIDGVVEGLKVLEAKHRKLRSMAAGLEELTITTAFEGEAEEVLGLQRLAFRSEAEIYNDFEIAPLTQTPEELKEDFKTKVFYKALMNGSIVGSVRGYLENGTVFINRLIVNPIYQNLGIGKKLMRAIEAHFPGAARFEMATGHKSRRNIYFLQKQGYKIFMRKKISEKSERVFMEKKAAG
jgi:ech hydrogenase subunit C